jgi:hypothetical protein
MEFANEISRSRYFRQYCDFGTIIDLPEILLTATGTVAANTVVAPQTADQVGVVRHDTGTDATGLAGWLSAAALLRLDNGGKTKHEQSIRSHSVLSTGAQTYFVRAGIMDVVAVEPVDGVYFRYNEAQNSGKWQFVTRANSVETVTDTGVLFAINTNYRLSIEVLGDASKAFGSINGVPVASSITNIPTGAGREVGVGASINKTVGATAVFLYSDYTDTVVVFR